VSNEECDLSPRRVNVKRIECQCDTLITSTGEFNGRLDAAHQHFSESALGAALDFQAAVDDGRATEPEQLT
jgi:hypothetical protein